MAASSCLQLSRAVFVRSLNSIPETFLIRRWQHAHKKFYKNVTITQSNGLYEVNLDNRKLKTPLGKVFQVPNETLAIAVATEWDTQKTVVNRLSMHLTALCNTVQDNPMGKTKETLADIIMTFLETDTICCRLNEPTELADLQRNEWDPILQWFCQRYDVEMEPSQDICGPIVPSKTKEVLGRHFISYNLWALTGIHYATEALKSVVLTLATIDRLLSIEQAVSLSRLELEFQISHWGNVEWSHDVDLMDLRSRVASAIFFAHLNSESWSAKYKTV